MIVLGFAWIETGVLAGIVVLAVIHMVGISPLLTGLAVVLVLYLVAFTRKYVADFSRSYVLELSDAEVRLKVTNKRQHGSGIVSHIGKSFIFIGKPPKNSFR